MTTREEGLDRIREALDIHADGERLGAAKMTAAVEAACDKFDAYLSRLHPFSQQIRLALTEAGGRAALDAHDAEVRAETLREAADDRVTWQATLNAENDRHFATGSMHGAGPDVACDVFEDYLRALADRGPVT